MRTALTDAAIALGKRDAKTAQARFAEAAAPSSALGVKCQVRLDRRDLTALRFAPAPAACQRGAIAMDRARKAYNASAKIGPVRGAKAKAISREYRDLANDLLATDIDEA